MGEWVDIIRKAKKKKVDPRPTPFAPNVCETSRKRQDVALDTGAGDGGRTRDTKLGKLVLYQLSYARFKRKMSYAQRGGPCQVRHKNG